MNVYQKKDDIGSEERMLEKPVKAKTRVYVALLRIPCMEAVQNIYKFTAET